MWITYLGGCVGAGLFALLPGRYLGQLLWHHALGLIRARWRMRCTISRSRTLSNGWRDGAPIAARRSSHATAALHYRDDGFSFAEVFPPAASAGGRRAEFRGRSGAHGVRFTAARFRRPPGLFAAHRHVDLAADRWGAPAAAPRTAEPGDDALESLRRLLAAHAAPAQPRLRLRLRMIPVGEVLAFEAADKYLLVVTAAGETPIRVPLRELQPQLDPDEFWQIHRGTVVRASAIESATRDEAGRIRVRLRGLERALAVSRLYAQRSRPL